MPFAATWMDLEIVILSEVSYTEKDKYHDIAYMWNLEKMMIQTNLYTKQKQTHRHRKQTYSYQRGKGGWGGINQEFGINIYTLLYMKEVNNKDLLYSTGNSTQYSVITYMRKNLKKNEYMYMYN